MYISLEFSNVLHVCRWHDSVNSVYSFKEDGCYPGGAGLEFRIACKKLHSALRATIEELDGITWGEYSWDRSVRLIAAPAGASTFFEADHSCVAKVGLELGKTSGPHSEIVRWLCIPPNKVAHQKLQDFACTPMGQDMDLDGALSPSGEQSLYLTVDHLDQVERALNGHAEIVKMYARSVFLLPVGYLCLGVYVKPSVLCVAQVDDLQADPVRCALYPRVLSMLRKVLKWGHFKTGALNRSAELISDEIFNGNELSE